LDLEIYEFSQRDRNVLDCEKCGIETD
jgi:hypothetical protein